MLRYFCADVFHGDVFIPSIWAHEHFQRSPCCSKHSDDDGDDDDDDDDGDDDDDDCCVFDQTTNSNVAARHAYFHLMLSVGDAPYPRTDPPRLSDARRAGLVQIPGARFRSR